MYTYIALIRGLGGRYTLPMKSLVRMLEDMGMTNVVTYIQSGNAVFQSASTHREEIAQQLKAEIDRQYGFAPHVIILTREELRAALEGNPYPDATSSPNTLHIFFLASEPESPRIDRLEDLRTPNERFTLLGKVFYLHAPDGVGRSKLFANIERSLGVPATARNWRSATKILEIADQLEVSR